MNLFIFTYNFLIKKKNIKEINIVNDHKNITKI